MTAVFNFVNYMYAMKSIKSNTFKQSVVKIDTRRAKFNHADVK